MGEYQSIRYQEKKEKFKQKNPKSPVYPKILKTKNTFRQNTSRQPKKFYREIGKETLNI